MPDDSTGSDPSIDDRLNASPVLPHSKVEAEPIRFSLKGLLLGVTLLVCAVALITWLVRIVSIERRQNEIRNVLRTAYLGVLGFDDARKKLPAGVVLSPEGQPLSSWRFMIAPYMGWNHGGDYKGPWDSAANRYVRSGWAADFLCSRPSARSPFHTIVYGITGPGTAFEPSDYPYFSEHTYGDLPANLILLIEVADSNTHWMQPGDYDVTKLLAATGRLGDTVKGLLKDRIHILFADGEVWALSPDMPIDALKPFLTIAAAMSADRDQQLAPYRVD